MNDQITKYKSVDEFFEDAKSQGYSVPLSMCLGLTQLMKAKGLTFEEAYNYLSENGKIIMQDKMYIYDLSASKLWEKKDDEEL